MELWSTDRESLERESEVEFVKGSGPGGQHRNKRETGVRLRHLPTGIVVMATERRSQARNRALAFERLAARLELLNEVQAPRIPTRIPQGIQRARLDSKRQQAQKKTLRRRVTWEV